MTEPDAGLALLLSTVWKLKTKDVAGWGPSEAVWPAGVC